MIVAGDGAVPLSGARKFCIVTFGCRTNQADSAALRQDFLSNRFQETHEFDEADVLVVNSCTVTHRSDQQVRQLTRRLRRENPRARIVVTGCYAQREPRALARMEAVDLVIGNTHKNDLVQIAIDSPSPTFPLPPDARIAEIHQDDFYKVRALGLTSATQTGGRTRPFVKIQDGCDAKCSYCIIPKVRGPSRSVPAELVLQQVRELVEEGYKEIVLTGIHMGTYGRYLQPRSSLDRLLGSIVAVPGLRRVRLSSIEPMQLSRRITELAAAGEKIAPHFHVCLQSGSDTLLKKMLRPYSTSRFAGIVEDIRHRIPEAAIGTDVIAGFPGETGEDHARTVEFVRRMPFTYLHVFPYSDRTGTTASTMCDKVEPQVIRARSEELREISRQKNEAFRGGFVRGRLSVLTLDEEKDGMRTAISGNYLKAKLNRSVEPNQIIEGTVLKELPDGYLVVEAAGSEASGSAGEDYRT